MNRSDDWWTNPPWILAAGAAVALIVASILWGLSYFLPALAAAFGYLAAGVIHGAVSGAVAGWFSTAAFYGGTFILVGGGISVGIRIVNQTAKKPFYASVVILAACQTFLLDLAKELWPGENVSKWLFKASTALLFAIAAAVWARGGWKFRTCAAVIFALMPLMVLSSAAAPYLNLGFRDAVSHVSANVWCAIAGFGCFVLAAVILARLLRAADYAA
jgi:hypothetical protein